MATIEETTTRVYTINLGKAWITPEHNRTDRVVNMIREFAKKHMKSNEIKLDQDLNRQLWSRGKTKPPRKVRVKMVKEEGGAVTVSLYEDLPAAATTTTTTTTTAETPATAENKEADIKTPAEITTTTEQSKEERTTKADTKQAANQRSSLFCIRTYSDAKHISFLAVDAVVLLGVPTYDPRQA